MYFKNVVALGALLSSVVAVPMHQHHKRDVIWKTVTNIDVVTVMVTTTIYGAAPQATPATADISKNHRQKHHTKHIKSTITVVPSPAGTSPAETSPYVAPSPTTTETPVAAPSTPTQAPAPKPSSGGSTPQGQTFSGDITYYTPGLGSCGLTNTDTDMIVAVAEDIMAAQDDQGNPNKNPLCGKTITISHGGVQAQATIVDTCPGCAGQSLDLSPSLFLKFAQLSVGRVSGVEWWYD